MIALDIHGPPNEVLPVSFEDMVFAIVVDPSIHLWAMLEYYGAAKPGCFYLRHWTYDQLTTELERHDLVVMTSEELRATAVATFDIYDVLVVGLGSGGHQHLYRGRDPWERFWFLTRHYPVVAECVDSGFWRVGIADDSMAEQFQKVIAAIPGTLIEHLEPSSSRSLL